jgi:hypothetical protein
MKLPAYRSATARNSLLVSAVRTGSAPTARSMKASFAPESDVASRVST